MDSDNKMEYRKSELSLEINSFDKPAELTGVKAWSQMLLDLLFLVPGTYPSLPEMGIGIQQYEYGFVDEAIDRLRVAINNQAQQYLPDIPLAGTMVTNMDYQGQQIIIVQFIFQVDGRNETTAVAVNAETGNKRFLDFDVSW